MADADDVIDQTFRLLVTLTPRQRENVRELYLAQFGPAIIPFCRHYFQSTERAEVRSNLVRFVIRYARDHEEAIDFGLEALDDRSPKVRESACAVLAYSANVRTLPRLIERADAATEPTRSHARNAILAIEENNHNLYYPRYHMWHVSTDDPDQPKDADVDYYIKTNSPTLVGPLTNIFGSVHGKWQVPDPPPSSA